MSKRPQLIITLGDPCGISGELLLRSLHAINRWADVLVIGAKVGLDLLESTLHDRVHWRWGAPPTPLPSGVKGKGYGLWTTPDGNSENPVPHLVGYALWLDPTPEVTASQLSLGYPSAASGRCAVEAIKRAAELMIQPSSEFHALVTLPLSKAAIHLAGCKLPGHTEMLQQYSGAPITRMAFVSPSLSVVLHTVHQSLRSVLLDLNADEVAETLSFAADRFIQLTGKLDLRVALCALNPHAGENGAFGEEEAILNDAVIQAEASFMDFNLADQQTPYSDVASPFSLDFGSLPQEWQIFPSTSPFPSRRSSDRCIEIMSPKDPAARPTRPAPQFFGPLPADSIYHRATKGEFDLVVALYHDQGLIPLKVLEPYRAVNLTLGLPFIRTSPDHGTAFDKAGKWDANPTNFLEATALAVRLAGRARKQPWNANPDTGSGLTFLK